MHSNSFEPTYPPASTKNSQFCESPLRRASPVSTAFSMLLLNHLPRDAHLGGSPILDMNRLLPAKKPLKGILKKKTQGAAADPSKDPFRRAVSFGGLCNSRWESDNCHHGSRLRASALPHLRLNVSFPSLPGGDKTPTKNFAWSSTTTSPTKPSISNVPKAAQSPRLPRRRSLDAMSIVAEATTPSPPSPPPASATMRRPRRMRSHENLFQHKIDFFLEQTAAVENKLSQSSSNVYSNPDSKGNPNKDIEELESSLMSMQSFLVALSGVPDNQKLLQKHMQHQTNPQAQMSEQHYSRSQEETDEVKEDEDDDDVSLVYSDEEDDDEDLDAFLQEIQNRPLPSWASSVDDMLNRANTNASVEDLLDSLDKDA